MQLKATKFVALLSRLRLAPLALFAALGLDASAPLPAAAAGTVAVSRNYVCFNITKRVVDGDILLQLSELALYDANGGRINLGLTNVNSLAELKENTNSCYADKNGKSGEDAGKLFDGSIETKYCSNLGTSEENIDVKIYMHFAEAKAISSYNLASGNDTDSHHGRAPKAGTLSVSSDGDHWTKIADWSAATGDNALTSSKAWYNNGVAYDNLDLSGLPFLERLALDPHRVSADDAHYATGGDIILHLDGDGYDDYVHIFTNTAANAAFTPNANLHARLLMIAGGGSGGGCNGSSMSGGGGAGGLIYSNDIVLVSGTAYNVTVGAGGAGVVGKNSANSGNDGNNTTFVNDSSFSLTAVHGGGGGGWYGSARTGGSGGGGAGDQGSTPYPPAAGTPGQGYEGGVATVGKCGGGGGGAGEPGHGAVESPYVLKRAGDGGDGLAFDITGTMEYYAGGGGAGSGDYPHRANGGLGGGGVGTTRTFSGAGSGEDGKGSGGGAAIANGHTSGKGGDGIVIVRYCAYVGASPLVRPCTVEVTGASSAEVKGAMASMGAGASSATVTMTLTPKGNAGAVEKTFTLVTVSGEALTADRPFTCQVDGLAAGTTYDYAIRATNNNVAEVTVQQGEITTHSASFVATVTGGGVEVKKIGFDTAIVFKENGTLTLDGMGCAQVLVVGGGGGGGSVSGGGGGGGGVYYNPTQLLKPGTYAVKVGAGGKGTTGGTYSDDNTAGEGSSLVGAEVNVSVLGGGRGARWDGSVAGDGGCGGGASGNRDNGHGTLNQNSGNDRDMQGYDGGVQGGSRGSGGGGATENGQPGNSTSGGAGGAGLLVNITDEWLDYGSGGGGACSTQKGSTGPGGAGGGAGAGRGANSTVTTDADKFSNGLNGRGGGGGGGNGNPYDGFYSGSGGSGVVIVRFPGSARFTVALNPNGGTAGGTTEVTATPGEPMPAIAQEDLPTRTGYAFQGYSAEGWKVTRMTGDEADIINYGDGLFAYSANESYTVNGVQFENKFAKGADTFEKIDAPTMTFSQKIEVSDGNSGDCGKPAGYGKMMKDKMYVNPGNDLKVTLSGLTSGHSYLVQIVCHKSDGSHDVFGLNVGGVSYECHSKAYGDDANREDENLQNVTYGRSFVYRFEADSATHSFDVNRYGPGLYGNTKDKYGSFVQINAMQLRDITEVEGSLKYYNADGSSAQNFPLNNIPTELFAMWDNAPLAASLTASATDPTSATVTLKVAALGEEDELLAVLRWGTTENCTEGARILNGNNPVAVGSSLVENLTGLIPGTNYYAKVEFVRTDHSVAPIGVVPMTTFTTPAVAADAWAALENWSGTSDVRMMPDGSIVLIYKDTSALGSFGLKRGGYARVLAVGGGGAGGYNGHCVATGGGGGGEVLDRTVSLVSGTYEVKVGMGGVHQESGVSYDKPPIYYPNGSNSWVRQTGSGEAYSLCALGGGGGGSQGKDDGGAGANGGGGNAKNNNGGDVGVGGLSVDGRGFAGGGGYKCNEYGRYGGGGGGAGGFGVSADAGRLGDGGVGLHSAILDLPEDDDLSWYGGGGGGGGSYGDKTQGGRGGGANSPGTQGYANNGLANSGGGGSGYFSDINNANGGLGGSGIVIVRVYGPAPTFTVALNANGGTGGTTEVTATVGQPMPTPITLPTRPGHAFRGYVAEGWEARLMTGNDTDICNEGTTEFAKMVGTPPTNPNPCLINNVSFDQLTDPANFARMPMPNLNRDATACGTEDKGNSGYGRLLSGTLYNSGSSNPGSSYTFELKGLTPGNSYLFQFFVHDGRSDRRDFEVSVDNANWYRVGCDPNVADPTRSRYGVTFINRFVAQAATESVTVYYRNNCVAFNAAQLRDITGASFGNVMYYNADGTSATNYPVANGPRELFAQWEIALPTEYEQLDCLDNGDVLANAGFVCVDFQLQPDHVVRTKYAYNTDPTYTDFGTVFMSIAYYSEDGNLRYGLARQASAKAAFCYGVRTMSTGQGGYKELPGSASKGVHEVVCQTSGAQEISPTPGTSTGPTGGTIAKDALPNKFFIMAKPPESRVCDKSPYALDGTLNGCGLIKMYYLTVTNASGTVLLDLVPAKQKSDNAEGLYDLVGGKFYPLRKPCGTASPADPNRRAAHEVGEWHDQSATDDDCGWHCGMCTNCMLVVRQMIPATQPVRSWPWNGADHRPTIDGANGQCKLAGCDISYSPGTAWTDVGQSYSVTLTPATGHTWTDGTTTNVIYNYAITEPEFHVMRTDGPKIVVKKSWLDALAEAKGIDKTHGSYQSALFETNASGVVAWQAYVLGAAATPEAVANMAIVEETVQNNDPETVTIRLRGLPEETARPNDTGCTVKYSLYSATTPGGLAKGGGDPVGDRQTASTFEAPLSDLTDLEPVNYYRIRVHFIFNKSE